MEAKNTLAWLQAAQNLGPAAFQSVNVDKTVRWLARAYGVPEEMLQDEALVQPNGSGGGLPSGGADLATLTNGAVDSPLGDMDPTVGDAGQETIGADLVASLGQLMQGATNGQ